MKKKKAVMAFVIIIFPLCFVEAMDLKISGSPCSFQIVKFKGKPKDEKRFADQKSQLSFGGAVDFIFPIGKGFSFDVNLSCIQYRYKDQGNYLNGNAVGLFGFSFWFGKSRLYATINLGGGMAFQKHKEVMNFSPSAMAEVSLGFALAKGVALELTGNGQYNYQKSKDEDYSAHVINIRTFAGLIFHF